MKSVRITSAVLMSVALFTAVARADAPAVNKYLAEATELVGKGGQFFEDATRKLDLAEASMDDVPEAEKPALKAKIDALKSQIQASANEGEKLVRDRKAKALIEELEGVVGNLVVWPGKSAELTELLNDPKTVAALGEPAVAAYKKQFATMQKLHGSKALKENLATAKAQVDDLTKSWAERKPKIAAATDAQSRDSLLIDTERDLEQIGRFFKDLPPDDAAVKPLLAAVQTVRTEHAAAVGNSGAAEQVSRINGYLESNKDEFAGMDAETTPPTWADYKASKGLAREFNAPKTLEFVRRVSYWMPTFEKEDAYVAAKDAPAVKAKMDEVKAKLAAARTKIKTFAGAIVDGLEAEKVSKDNVGETMGLTSQIGNALGAESDDGKALMARVTKAQNDYKNAGDKAEADTLAYYKTMTEQANKAWPAMAKQFDAAESFDPNNAAAMKGKYVKIVSNNLMGWRFKHGDFPYATTINGVSVAGKYDPAVLVALAEVEKKLGRAIGDSDDDGQWIAIARVEGTTGQLVKLETQSGDVSVDGTKVGTVESRVERPMDAPIVTIVALKAGPVAVAAGQGAVTADGSVAPVAVAGSSSAARSGRGFSVIGLLSGVLALVVGAACLMKSGFAPLAGNAGAANLMNKAGSDNLAYAGLAAIALGVLGVLLNLIAVLSAPLHAVLGVVSSLAMIIAGVVVARDFLAPRGLLPTSVATPLAQYAVPAGLACAALGALTIVMSVF